MQKKIALSLITIIVMGVALLPVLGRAQETPQEEMTRKVTIEVFERDDCGHCRDFFAFIEQLDRNDIEIIAYDIYTFEGKKFFNEVTDALRLVKGTPIIYLNETIIQGFDKPETTGAKILTLIENAQTKESLMSLREYILVTSPDVISATNEGVCDESSCELADTFSVTVPFVGWIITPSEYSLPVMSLVLGTIDGFNPCAMWVLVLFLTALVAVGNKRKMIEIAGLFIVAEGVMYYLILTVWLYAWDFIGLDQIITPIVGLVAIGGGLFFLYEWKKSDGTCQVTDFEQKKRISQRVKDFAQKPLTLVTALGIIGLALSVNVIEFACSIGIPQAFTKILDINNLSWISKQGYNLIYILGYMIDDILVFGIALYSFDKIGITTKYSKASNLIGGILMLILGLILIFAPQLLVL